jgi:hypothetical protein
MSILPPAELRERVLAAARREPIASSRTGKESAPVVGSETRAASLRKESAVSSVPDTSPGPPRESPAGMADSRWYPTTAT